MLPSFTFPLPYKGPQLVELYFLTIIPLIYQSLERLILTYIVDIFEFPGTQAVIGFTMVIYVGKQKSKTNCSEIRLIVQASW